jgi:hypothetical protein
MIRRHRRLQSSTAYFRSRTRHSASTDPARRVAARVTARRNGKVFYEYEITDFKMDDRLDDKLLEKPH